MKLINVTDSHHRLVLNQLESTDAQLVEIYSAGSTTVIYTEAPLHNEIIVMNKERAITQTELKTVNKFFKRKMKSFIYDEKKIQIVEQSENLVEFSIPHEQQ